MRLDFLRAWMVSLVFWLFACGGAASTPSDGDPSGGETHDAGAIGTGNSNPLSDAGTSTSADDGGVPAVYLKFTSSAAYQSTVTVSRDGDYIVIDSNGIPNHKSPYFSPTDSRYQADSDSGFEQNPNSIVTQALTFRIPVNPTPASSPTETPMGPIGVSLNGVPFFNQYAAQRTPLTTEIVSFDQYGGHPQQQGQYHYHVEPTGLTGQPNNLGKSALLGFLLDGYPVYGPEENGVTLTSADLDQYHGHTTATADYPNGIYHYHITADSPYINGDDFYGVAGTVSQ